MHSARLWFVCCPRFELDSPRCAFCCPTYIISPVYCSNNCLLMSLVSLCVRMPMRVHMCGSVRVTTRWHKYVGLSQNCRPLRRESTVLTHTHLDMLTYSERVQDPLTDVTTQLIIKMWEWEWRLPLWSRLIQVVCLITHEIQDSSHLHTYPTRSLRNTAALMLNSRRKEECENWPLCRQLNAVWEIKMALYITLFFVHISISKGVYEPIMVNCYAMVNYG